MKKTALLVCLLTFLVACAAQTTDPESFNFADFQVVKILPYDSPTQVIYRIDDHRFVTLERYRDCNHGDTYYNDTTLRIRHFLGRGSFENFQGELILNDPTGQNLVFPSSLPPNTACSERGCLIGLTYSTDGGRTFSGAEFLKSFHPFDDTARYTVLVTSDSYFVEEKFATYSLVEKNPLVRGYRYGDGKIPGGRKIQHGVKMPLDRNSLSGQSKISCRSSIGPTNPDALLK